MLNENSIYTTPQERDDFLKLKNKVADALLFNLFGFVSMFAAFHKQSVKEYKNVQEKVRIHDIIDTNTDISLSVRLAYDAKLIDTSTANKLTRLLALFKQGKIAKATDIDDTLVHELFSLCKFDSKCKVSSDLLSIVKQYNEREINIAYLARLLYKKCKLPHFKGITQEFAQMYRKGGYNNVYSDFETGYTKLKMGVPHQYVRKSTSKTIIFKTDKQTDAKGVITFITTLTDENNQLLNTNVATFDPFKIEDDKDTNVLTVDDVMKVAQQSDTQVKDSKKIFENTFLIANPDIFNKLKSSDMKPLSEIDDPLLRYFCFVNAYIKAGKSSGTAITDFFRAVDLIGKGAEYNHEKEDVSIRNIILEIEKIRFGYISHLQNKINFEYAKDVLTFFTKYNIQLPDIDKLNSDIFKYLKNKPVLFRSMTSDMSCLNKIISAFYKDDIMKTDYGQIYGYMQIICNNEESNLVDSNNNDIIIFKNISETREMKEKFDAIKLKHKMNDNFIFVLKSKAIEYFIENDLMSIYRLISFINKIASGTNGENLEPLIKNLVAFDKDLFKSEYIDVDEYIFSRIKTLDIPEKYKLKISLALSYASNERSQKVDILKTFPKLLENNDYGDPILNEEAEKFKNFDFDVDDYFTFDLISSDETLDILTNDKNSLVAKRFVDKYITDVISVSKLSITQYQYEPTQRFFALVMKYVMENDYSDEMKSKLCKEYLDRISMTATFVNTDISMIPHETLYNYLKGLIQSNNAFLINIFTKNLSLIYDIKNHTQQEIDEILSVYKTTKVEFEIEFLHRIMTASINEMPLANRIAEMDSNTIDFKNIDPKKEYNVIDLLKVNTSNYKDYIDTDKLISTNLSLSSYTKMKKNMHLTKVDGDTAMTYFKVILAKQLYENPDVVFKTSIKANKPLSEDAQTCIYSILKRVDLKKIHISLFEFYSKEVFAINDYKIVAQGFNDQLKEILTNPRFELFTDNLPSSYENIALINGIGVSPDSKDIFEIFKKTNDFVEMNKQILLKSIAVDIKKDPVMKIDDVINDSISLEDETNTINKTLNGKHGNVRCVVDTIYTIDMDSTLFDKFKIKDSKNRKSDSQGEVTSNMFHGTGSVAVNFISKFGFADISDSSSGIQIAGKMLGSGIYFAKNIDKSLSYIGDVSFAKSYKAGYIIVCDVILGEKNVDYRSESGGRILSPEWCIKNYGEQILVRKILKVRSQPKY